MEVTVTGASGLIGRALVSALAERGEQVTVLSRDPEGARAKLPAGVRSERWDPLSESAPGRALEGRDAIVHLAGAPVAQRWDETAKQAIRESRVTGTANLVAGLRALESDARPGVLISSSAIGYYGQHGIEPIDEEAPAGAGFLADVCRAWEAAARAAGELGLRNVQVRTGVVLDRDGGALAKMLPPFRLGVGGPVAGGHQYVAWIHLDDVVEMMLAALSDERWSGPFNATAPEPVTNRELARALGAALHRPAILPVPGLALRVLYGEMAEIVTTGVRAVPAKALVFGYQFVHPELRDALAAALR
jgi:uncharacterized protein